MKAFTGLVIGAILAIAICGNVWGASPEKSQVQLQAKAIDTLKAALAEQSKFVKVHAAEALLALSYGDDVAETFQHELKLHGEEPSYRTGIWRVLAQSLSDHKVAKEYIHRLCDVALDPNSPDRVNAFEALAKLKYQIPLRDRQRFEAASFEPSTEGYVCWRWLLAVSGDDKDLQMLADSLDSPDKSVRNLAAYALRHLSQRLPTVVVDQLAKAAVAAGDSKEGVHLIAAAYATARDDKQKQQFTRLLAPFAKSENPRDRCEVANVLALRGAKEDSTLPSELLNDPDVDVRVSAANAVLRIDRRHSSPVKWLDFLVLAGYAASMLAIGWYCSRGNTTTEQYLLGGRSMKALPVGLSYFATMFSTISYLSVPGEVIRNGPMWIFTILALPFAFVVVGYFLIPYIMRLNVTTAYEILEKRFGLSVRMLGSGIFVALRLAWMGTILFGMSHHVLVPLLGLDPSATPWVTVTLGLITVAYTSMGGLQAVVWTDVAQTVVLMFGAILSIVMISVYLGGPFSWWPSVWPANWEPPKIWFDPTARLTAASVALSMFTWYICTAGSDQMAVQRYLATRDASSARRMFGISLLCDAFVATLLNLLGIALFAYFKSHPQLLPDNETITTGSDQLFPQFIVKGLPGGISGLVIAGLAAAAMSSLASGVSSTCSVVTVDWVGRLRKSQTSDRAQVHLCANAFLGHWRDHRRSESGGGRP